MFPLRARQDNCVHTGKDCRDSRPIRIVNWLSQYWAWAAKGFMTWPFSTVRWTENLASMWTLTIQQDIWFDEDSYKAAITVTARQNNWVLENSNDTDISGYPNKYLRNIYGDDCPMVGEVMCLATKLAPYLTICAKTGAAFCPTHKKKGTNCKHWWGLKRKLTWRSSLKKAHIVSWLRLTLNADGRKRILCGPGSSFRLVDL